MQASSKLANDLVSLDTRGEPRLRRNVRAPFVPRVNETTCTRLTQLHTYCKYQGARKKYLPGVFSNFQETIHQVELKSIHQNDFVLILYFR